MRSLREGLQRRLIGALTALFAVLALGLYLVTRHLLVAQFDATLEAKARVLATLVKRAPDGQMDVDLAEEPMPEFERRREPEYYELTDLAGRSIARSPSLGSAPLARPAVAEKTTFDVTLPDGRRGRLIGLRFVPVDDHDDEGPDGSAVFAQPPPPLLLVLARSRAELDGALLRVSLATTAVGVLLLLGAVLLVQAVLTRGLLPLAEVATHAEAIDAGSLDARFAVEGIPEELAAITRRLNDLLSRLQGSFERERRFSADVAHELRTPVAELRTLAEVELDSHPDVLAIALQMERTVANLLALARCDAGRQEVRLEWVDLAAAATEAWRSFAGTAAQRQLAVSFRTAPALVETDRALLFAMLANLYSNAVDYTPRRGEISCIVELGALVLAHPRPGLTEDDVKHVLEPFWRKDSARTDGRHSGLGLALVAAYAQLARGEARTDLDGRRFRITLRFAAANA